MGRISEQTVSSSIGDQLCKQIVLTRLVTGSDFEVLRPKFRSFWLICFSSSSTHRISHWLWTHWTILGGPASITTNLSCQIAPLLLVYVGHNRDYLAFWLLL